MHLRLKTRILDLYQPVVMGVLNVTPDSFSDGGRYVHVDAALARARVLLEQGAVLVDVGGESTRPGAEPVSEQEELNRVIPVIKRLTAELRCIVSIDTMKPSVMRAACAAGAELINDVNALRAPGALQAAHDTGAGIVLMHMQNSPQTMQDSPQYESVTMEVATFLRQRLDDCIEAGIARDRIAVDPGFGFGKTLAHNLELLGALGSIAPVDVPLLVGLSRKSMFKALLNLAVEERVVPSAVAAALAVYQGAAIVRAHDVPETVQAVRVAAALRNGVSRTGRANP